MIGWAVCRSGRSGDGGGSLCPLLYEGRERAQSRVWTAVVRSLPSRTQPIHSVTCLQPGLVFPTRNWNEATTQSFWEFLLLQCTRELPAASCVTTAGARALLSVFHELHEPRGEKRCLRREDRDEETAALCGGLHPPLETVGAQVRLAYRVRLRSIDRSIDR